MENMRYKIFNAISGQPLGYTDDITAAVVLLTHFRAASITASLMDRVNDIHL